MRNETFGRLLKAGIGSIVTVAGKTAPVVEEELGGVIGVAPTTIQYYKAGNIPPDLRTIEILAEAAVKRGLMGREWLEHFLHAAHYPAPEKLLDKLCPIAPVRQRPPRIYENLPAPTYSQFVMRQQAFAEVAEGLGKRSAAVLLVGFGGNGKTSLAREVADACLKGVEGLPQFDAAVWVSDKDRPGTTNLSVVLDEVARTLDYPGFTQFEHDEKRREVEQLLRRQRVLVVVDNFETITDGALLSWLLNLPEPSKALITTREYRREFRRGGWPVDLRGMTEAEARELIAERVRVLKIEKLVGDLSQLEPLLAATGGNPKAIEITMGLLKYERRPLQDVVDDLYAARGELFDDLFARAWSLLDEAARRVLMVMTFFPASAGGEALSATADVQGFAFDRAVERLIDLALVDVQQLDLLRQPRYLLHPLVRAFAASQLKEAVLFQKTARERWVSYFYALARQHRDESWKMAEQFNRAEPDISNFQAVIDHCYEIEHWSCVVDIVLSIKTFWSTRGYLHTRDKFMSRAIQAAEKAGDTANLVALLALKARTMCYLDDINSASASLSRARAILAAIPTPPPQLIENLNESFIRLSFLLGDMEKQLVLAQENVASAQKRGSPSEIFYSYYVAEYYFWKGDDRIAEEMFRDLLQRSTALDFYRSMITGYYYIAKIALKRGDFEHAEQALIDAHEIAAEMKHRRLLGEINVVWSRLYVARGERLAALPLLREAVNHFERSGMRRELAEAREELARLEAMITAPSST